MWGRDDQNDVPAVQSPRLGQGVSTGKEPLRVHACGTPEEPSEIRLFATHMTSHDPGSGFDSLTLYPYRSITYLDRVVNSNGHFVKVVTTDGHFTIGGSEADVDALTEQLIELMG